MLTPGHDIRGLSYFSYANIQGLQPKTVPSKVPTISDLLYEKKQMFFALSETWLREHNDAEVDIPGYHIFRCDRTKVKRRFGRNSGGVAIYVREDVAGTFECTLNFSNGSVETLAIFSKVLDLHIACVYRQPDSQANRSDAKSFKQAMHKLHTVLSAIRQQNIIIAGDFNLPHARWDNGGISLLPGSSKDEQEMIEIMENLMNNHFLNQLVSEPTHKDGNTLDLILTNNPDILHDLNITEPLKSTTHHFILEVASNLHSNIQCIHEEDTKEENSLPPLKSLNFHSNEVDWESMKNSMEEVDWDSEFTDISPDEMVERILLISHRISKQYVPERRARNKAKQIPKDRRSLMRRRNRINNRLRRNAVSPAKREALRRELIQTEKQLNQSRKASRLYEEQKAIQAIKKNSKYFFAYAKKFSKTSHEIGPLKDADGQYVYSKSKIADMLSNQYQGVFTQPTRQCPSQTEMFPEEGPEQLKDISISEDDFISAIKELSSTAGSGPDGMPAILLKKCKEAYSKALKILWQKCYDLGITPTCHKLAYIIPIHKGGMKAMASNYRPVALTSHLVKLFEKVVRGKMVKFMEEHNKFNNNQHGFRSGRSCLSELIAHYDEIIELLEHGIPVDTVYLDFSKAFDKVDHHRLLQKLSETGIGGKLGRWIQSFLTKRKQSVLVNNQFSEEVDVVSGVPQGSVLGPLLFVIMINDIDETVKEAKIRCFADDTRATKGVGNVKQASELQTDLEEIYDWASKNKMEFNNKKFELMRYRLSTNPIQSCTSYTDSTGNIIQEKENIKDLGVIMSNDASFKTHVKKVTDSLRNIAAWILRTFRTRDKQALLTAWKTLALPIHDYCSQLWSPYSEGEKRQLELIQWNFIRKISEVQSDDYWEALKKLGLNSLERRRDRYRIIYLWKTMEGLVPSLGLESTWNPRRGRTIKPVEVLRKAPTWVKQAKSHAFKHESVRMWNLLPIGVRNTTQVSTDTFKYRLDKYLTSIKDQPRIPSMTSQCITTSNCLAVIIPVAEAERIQAGVTGSNKTEEGGATLTSLH